MRMMVLTAMLLTVAGCPGDAAEGEPDASVDAAPGACRFIEEPKTIAGPAPIGTFTIAWSCQGGCGDSEMLARPALVSATALEITPGMLAWTGPSGVIEQTPVTANGACWVATATDAGCRSRFDVCTDLGTVRANPIVWYDIGRDWGQRWRVDEAP